MRILLVEDEFLIAMSLETMMSSLGHDVVGPVSSSGEAKEIAAESEMAIVDFMLTDGPTGLFLADYLKKARRHRIRDG